jgi:hypothetical protein
MLKTLKYFGIRGPKGSRRMKITKARLKEIIKEELATEHGPPSGRVDVGSSGMESFPELKALATPETRATTILLL